MIDWMLTGFSGQTLAILFAVAAAALLLLYILKSKADIVEVPHVSLWQQVLREERASSWWQRWKRWFSLLILLLTATAIIVALGDPMDEEALERGGSVVFVIDQSGSMRALDGGENQSRFERAKSLAQKAVERLDSKDEAALVVSDSSVTTLVPFTREHQRLRDAIADLEPQDLAGSGQAGFDHARTMLRERSSSRILVYTDQPVSGSTAEETTATVETEVIGTEHANLAVNTFRLRRYPLSPSDFEALVRISNTSDTPQTVKISIRADGELVNTYTEELGPNSTESYIYTQLPDAGRRWTASVEPIGPSFTDIQPADDTGYATLTDRSEIRLLLISDGNLYLEAPLLLNESVNADRISWAEFERMTAEDREGYDAFILDGVSPDFATEVRGDMLIFPDHKRPEEASTLTDPIIDRIHETHRVMRGIPTLRDVNIARASRIETQEGDEVVARAIGGEPMIVTRRTPSGSVVEFAFHPAESDLPLRVAFPLMLANVADWFRLSGGNLQTSYDPGETVSIPVPESVMSWEVRYDPTFPTSTTESWMNEATIVVDQARSSDAKILLRPTHVGFYTLRGGEHSIPIAVGGMPEEESRIAVASEDQTEPSESQPNDEQRDRSRPIWTQLLLVALALIFFEWITWTRRLTV